MNNYSFAASTDGSYLTQGTTLPNPRHNCQYYLAYNCLGGSGGCSGGSGTCTGNCATGCTGYLTETQNAQTNLCCHTSDDNCENNCGQSQNMAACGILVEDYTAPNVDPASMDVACTRSCQSRCLDVPGAVGNTFPYHGIFQVSRKSDDSSNGCKIWRSDSCSTDRNDDCQPMLNDDNYNPWQSCTYNAVEFAKHATSQDLAEWRASEGNPSVPNESRNYDELMIRWCAEPTPGPCFPDPLDLTTSASCSRYYSNTDDGTSCRLWVDNKPNNTRQNYVDAIGHLYCTNPNQNTNECKCINRALDPTYQATKSLFPANDGCWYRPCTQTWASRYFLPSDVTPAICPTNVCENIIYASDYQSAYIGGNQTYLNCDFSNSSS